MRALVVVDLQIDFAWPAGGDLVAYTQDHHPAQTPHFDTAGGRWPPHGVQGTPGAELVHGLVIDGPVICKGRTVRTATAASRSGTPGRASAPRQCSKGCFGRPM